MDTNGADSEEDEIVLELPIYLSKSCENDLYSFRYNLQSKTDRKELDIRKGYFRPENRQIQLELAMDLDSQAFVPERAQSIAERANANLEGQRQSQPQDLFENDAVDKICLSSLETVEEDEKFAVMAFTGEEIHLSTVKSVFEFRPSFRHLEKGKDASAASNRTVDNPQPGPSGAQAVTVKFKNTRERSNREVNLNYKEFEKRRAEEPWIECDYCPQSSLVSELERRNLFADTSVESGPAVDIPHSEYFGVLIPEDQEQACVQPTLPSHIMSLLSLRSLPIEEQCRQLLKHVKIISFKQLLMNLTGGAGVTADALLKTIPKVAVLVRGNWVVKSEILYPPNTLSAVSGVPSELMCRARDYVLYLFTINDYVERKKISSITKIPSEELKEILTGFSKLSHNRGWELKLLTDHEFISKHPDIVQKQYAFWEQKSIQLMPFTDAEQSKRQRRKSKSISEDVNPNQSGAGLTSSSKTSVGGSGSGVGGGGSKSGPSYMSCSDDSGTEKNKSPVVARKNKGVKVKKGTKQGQQPPPQDSL